jgi:hypothetical protein
MTSKLPPGIYRIDVASGGGVERECLTRQGEKGVTILPPSAQPNPQQEWRVTDGKDGNVVIARPTGILPTSYLTYEGAPKKPEQGDPIVDRLSEFPPNEWHLVPAPGFRYFIRVADSELGIKIAPPTVHPPILDLGEKNQLEWVFERVPREEE